MKKVLQIGFGIIAVLYPLLVFYGLQVWNVRTLALILIVVFILRGILLGAHEQGASLNLVVVVMALMVVGGAFITNQPAYFLYYPVIMSLAMLSVFLLSVLRPPTVIEKIARVWEPDLPPEGVRYTRNVTLLWCVFFSVNGGVAWYTVHYCSYEQWMLYNGLISYLLMGMLFAGEYAYRQWVVKR